MPDSVKEKVIDEIDDIFDNALYHTHVDIDKISDISLLGNLLQGYVDEAIEAASRYSMKKHPDYRGNSLKYDVVHSDTYKIGILYDEKNCAYHGAAVGIAAGALIGMVLDILRSFLHFPKSITTGGSVLAGVFSGDYVYRKLMPKKNRDAFCGAAMRYLKEIKAVIIEEEEARIDYEYRFFNPERKKIEARMRTFVNGNRDYQENMQEYKNLISELDRLHIPEDEQDPLARLCEEFRDVPNRKPTEYVSDTQTDKKEFSEFIQDKMRERGVSWNTLIQRADFPQQPADNFISGHKRTSHRDIVLRFCYAAGLTLEETRQALKLYGMPELYTGVKRDSIFIEAFERGIQEAKQVNELLQSYDLEPLWR